MANGTAQRILVEITDAPPAYAGLVGHRAMRYTIPAIQHLLRLSPEAMAAGHPHARYVHADRFQVRDLGPAAFDQFGGA